MRLLLLLISTVCCKQLNKCTIGFYGRRCTQSCRDDSYGSRCSIKGCNSAGYCDTTVCDPGLFGENCEQRCAADCKNCSATSGCLDVSQTDVSSCTERCAKCDHGSCKECRPGFWGASCEIRCHCGGDVTCSRSTGACKVCAKNKYGTNCSETANCSPQADCKRDTGRCVCEGIYGRPPKDCFPCPYGKSGERCDVDCLYCGKNAKCRQDGTCVCEPGKPCEVCLKGWWGSNRVHNCTRRCGHCNRQLTWCRPDNGECECFDKTAKGKARCVADTCETGWTGTKCDIRKKNTEKVKAGSPYKTQKGLGEALMDTLRAHFFTTRKMRFYLFSVGGLLIVISMIWVRMAHYFGGFWIAANRIFHIRKYKKERKAHHDRKAKKRRLAWEKAEALKAARGGRPPTPPDCWLPPLLECTSEEFEKYYFDEDGNLRGNWRPSKVTWNKKTCKTVPAVVKELCKKCSAPSRVPLSPGRPLKTVIVDDPLKMTLILTGPQFYRYEQCGHTMSTQEETPGSFRDVCVAKPGSPLKHLENVEAKLTPGHTYTFIEASTQDEEFDRTQSMSEEKDRKNYEVTREKDAKPGKSPLNWDDDWYLQKTQEETVSREKQTPHTARPRSRSTQGREPEVSPRAPPCRTAASTGSRARTISAGRRQREEEDSLKARKKERKSRNDQMVVDKLTKMVESKQAADAKRKQGKGKGKGKKHGKEKKEKKSKSKGADKKSAQKKVTKGDRNMPKKA